MFWLVTIYNYLARHHTTWIKYFYMLAHIFRPESEAYLDLYRAYLRDLIKTLQVIFLSGNNKDLQQNAIMAAEETGICTCVLPFSDKISDLMASVDVMVTKAGELTSYETLARRLPVVLDNTIEPMPQEAPTMEALVGLGIAEKLNHPDDIIPIIDRLRARSNRRKPLPEQHQLDLTDHAVFDIESSLLRLIDKQAHADQSQSFREAA